MCARHVYYLILMRIQQTLDKKRRQLKRKKKTRIIGQYAKLFTSETYGDVINEKKETEETQIM